MSIADVRVLPCAERSRERGLFDVAGALLTGIGKHLPATSAQSKEDIKP